MQRVGDFGSVEDHREVSRQGGDQAPIQNDEDRTDEQHGERSQAGAI